MKKEEPISKIMTSEVVTIERNSSISTAEKVMRKKHIRHLPVVAGSRLTGIISLTDLQRLSFADNYSEEESSVDMAIYNMLKVDQVMVAHPVCVRETQSIREVAEILANKEFHALPVIDEEGNLKGIVTTTDLIRYLVDRL